MHRCATLHRILSAVCVAAAVSFVAAAGAQDAIPIAMPVSGGGGSASTGTAPRAHIMPATVVVPEASRINGADLGKKAHTNIRFLNPGLVNPLEAPPYGGYAYETPTSLGCVYKLVASLPAGCNPNSVTAVVGGGSQTIAIVDAYDDPEAPADLAYFSAQFGLPFSVNKFKVIYADGIAPPLDYSGGWEIEESLDIEYAHAMAPNAMLYLVEAASNSYTDLFNAVTVATNLVQCGLTTTCGSVTGKGEISMSWGGGEFSGETSYDTYFNKTNVVFFASSGDSPGPSYPSTSPNVVSVGGTSISRSATTGNYIGETSWADAGGGPSQVETIPSYQNAIAAVKAIVGTVRGTPDVSADANPYTGVWVYDTFPTDFYYYGDWWIVGGTSASSPIWAGVVNHASTANAAFSASSNAELTKLYNNLTTTATYNANFHDAVYGECYYYMADRSVTGWDWCTGLGSPTGNGGK